MSSKKSKLLESAQKNFLKGLYDKAVAEYRQIIQLDPADVRHRQRLAEILTKANQKDEAIKEYTALAKHYIDSVHYLKAIAVYKQIQKLDPTNPDVSLTLASLNEKQGLIGNATAEYAAAIHIYESNGENLKALRVLETMLAVDPHNSAVRLRIAEKYFTTGSEERAADEFVVLAKDLLERSDENGFMLISAKINALFRDQAPKVLARINAETGAKEEAAAVPPAPASPVIDQRSEPGPVSAPAASVKPAAAPAVTASAKPVVTPPPAATEKASPPAVAPPVIIPAHEEAAEELDELEEIEELDELEELEEIEELEEFDELEEIDELELDSAGGDDADWEEEIDLDAIAVATATAAAPAETAAADDFEPESELEDIELELELDDAALSLETVATDAAAAEPATIGSFDDFDLGKELSAFADEIDFDLIKTDSDDAQFDLTSPSGFMKNELDTEDAESHYSLGLAYKEMGLFDEAISEFIVAAHSPLRKIDCQILQGVCFRENGEIGKAVEILNATLNESTLNADEILGIKYELAICHEALDEKEQASKLYNEILLTRPDFSDTATRLSRL